MKLLLLLLIVINIYSRDDVANYIPVNAIKVMPDVYKVNDIVAPDIFMPWYFNALIEQESCVRLRGNSYWARRCWSPKSRLKTYWDKEKKRNREEGAGLLQLTRAWKKNGSLRFDTIMNLRRKYPKYLNELNWDNVYERPDLQIKAGLLLWKHNYDYLNNNIKGIDRVWFADSIYNGGLKYLLKERKECGLKRNCDPNKWFNNVEKMNARGHRVLYGKRTAWDINRDHVKMVKKRLKKYIKHHKELGFVPEKDLRIIELDTK